MEPHNDLKKQRDRFLAFAFAGADILIEVGDDGNIQFALGSIHHLIGVDDSEILNKPLKDLFDAESKELIDVLLSSARTSTKVGPYLVVTQNRISAENNKMVFISSLRMSPTSPISCIISKGDGLQGLTGFEDDSENKTIMTPKEFEMALRKKLPKLLANNKMPQVQLVELENVREAQKSVNPEQWQNLMASISQTIMDHSVDGESAVKIDEGKYLFLKDRDTPDDAVKQSLSTLSKEFDVDKVVSVASKSLAMESRGLNQKELTRAILYTVEKMEKMDVADIKGDMKSSFDSFMKENVAKISNFKRVISHQEFNLNFQPIVDIKTEAVSHHEVLVRFNSDISPYELITMGEDVGLAPDVDLSICRQSIKYIDFNMTRGLGKFAVNMSGSSVENDMFMDKLLAVLREYAKASKHLLFEITESSEIKDFVRVNNFIQNLRKNGYPVVLDDFGAGAASFQYLHQFEVDGIKIDGSYIKTILDAPREATMVKNITKMCHELDIYVVAEMIETREQARFLRDMGIDKGQGWLYGKATGQPVTNINK